MAILVCFNLLVGFIILPLMITSILYYISLNSTNPLSNSLALVDKDGHTFTVSRTFIEWLTDAEGNSHISIKGLIGDTFKQVQLPLQIGLDIDDLETLRILQRLLNCENIHIGIDRCNFYVSDIYLLYHIILPIFDSFGLNSSKVSMYNIWHQAVIIFYTKEHLTATGRAKLLLLRESIAQLVLILQPNTVFNISSNWLLGFIKEMHPLVLTN